MSAIAQPSRAGSPAPGFGAVFGLLVLVLVVVPVVFTAFRSPHQTASVEVFPIQRPVFGKARDPVGYLHRLLRDPGVPPGVEGRVGVLLTPAHVDKDVRISPKGDHALVSVSAGTPARASALLDAVVRELANASANDLGGLARAALAPTRAQLAAAPPGQRAALQRRLRALQGILAKPRQALVAPPRPGPARPPRLADRIVDALPGPFAPRTSPVELALIGLVLAFVLSLVIVRWTRPRSP